MTDQTQATPTPTPAPQPGNHANIDLPTNDEPLPDPLEIEIGEDGSAAPVEPAPAAPATAPAAPAPDAPPQGLKLKPGAGRGDNTIRTLRQRVQDAEAEIARRDQAFQEVLAGVGQVTERERRAQIAAFNHMEEGLKAKERLARYDLERAVESGDAKLQAEAQANLSAIQTQMVQVDSYKRANPQAFQVTAPQQQPGRPPVVPQQPQRTVQPQQPAAPEVAPATAAWVGANPWFNPESEDFNEEMHTAAVQYATRLERRYQATNRGHLIATPDYFKEVEAYMQREFPDDFESAAPATPPARNGGAPTVPSARTPPPGTPQPRNGSKITLTGEQRQLARQMARNGAIRNQDGSRMTDQQAEVYYAKFVAKEGN